MHNWNPDSHFNRQQIVLYDKFTQFTLLAAKEAIGQSGLNFDGHLGYDTGVVLGTAAGGVNTWDENYRTVYEEGKNRVHPFVVPKLMNNAAASHFPWSITSRAPVTVSTACASSNHAMGSVPHGPLGHVSRDGDGRVRIHAVLRWHQGGRGCV